MVDAGTIMSTVASGEQAVQATQQAVQQQQQGQPIAYVLFFLVPLVLFFFVQLLRALPLRADVLSRKPWNCDLCMSTWAGIVWAWPLYWLTGAPPWHWVALHLLPSVAICIWLLGLYKRLSVDELTPPP